MTHLYFSESAVPITAKVGIKLIFPHSRCFGSYFDVIFLMYLVSSGFFQANRILINHPHRPSLAKSECAERGVKHSIKSKVTMSSEPDWVYFVLLYMHALVKVWPTIFTFHMKGRRIHTRLDGNNSYDKNNTATITMNESFHILTLAMTSQYIGDKVSKSSSPDPRKILSLSWCVM